MKTILIILSILIFSFPCLAIDNPFKTTWNQQDGYLEVVGEKIHLKIYPSGKVEKLQWKELTNEIQNPYNWSDHKAILTPNNSN